jgi:hypothetical protein
MGEESLPQISGRTVGGPKPLVHLILYVSDIGNFVADELRFSSRF